MEDQLEGTSSTMEDDEERYFFAPSYIQEGLWFLNQIDEAKETYRVRFMVGLQAELDLSILHQTLEILIERHEILRTSFVVIDHQPMQAIALQIHFELPYIDISGLTIQEQGRKIQRLSQEMVTTPLELDKAPLFRVIAIHISEKEQLLLFLTHHIIMDGPSYQIFFDEITHLYTALLASEEPRLPELPLQYADYAAWQREMLQGEEVQPLIDYWREQLKNIPALLELPTDYPRPVVQTHQGAAEQFLLSSQINDGLHRLARITGTTLFMVLLSGFTMLLNYYSGQEDIVVGTPVSQRTRSEFTPLIGPFLTTLLLRTDLSDNPTFFELLMRIRTVCIEAYSHQEMPFEYLVELLKPERSLSYHPLFQVFFALNNFIAAPAPDETSPMQQMYVKSRTARFDLSCDFVLREQKLSYILEYDTALFNRETIVRMGQHLQNILEEIVADAQRRLSQIPLLTAQERSTLITTWNSTDNNYAYDSCIHEIFAEQVARVPQAIAIACDGRHLTYAELDGHAERIARHLRTQGTEAESLIGLCLARSEAFVICALGILKAGAAYIPLDPEYPAERLRFIIQDAHVQAVVTGADERKALPEYSGPVFLFSDLWEASDEGLPLPDRRQVDANNLAYVLYTSGSTGQPKGIQISHRSVVNFLTSMQKRPGFTEQDILLAVTSFSFDISGLELLLPLLTGGRVELATREMTLDSQLLLQKIIQSGATVMQATPVTWRMLLLNEGARFTGMKVLCGGEALPQDLARALLARGADLWNMYGPTETTIWSLLQQVQHVSADRPIIPIGTPIANTQVYILDQHDHLLPIGIPGELVIGGDGLARGYLQRPDITAERFMPDPFSQRPGARLYRTGDRARWLNDGSIEFLGRLDNQVKLRGFRLELGEIEALMNQHAEIHAAVAMLREGRKGQPQLVAYVVPEHIMPQPEELRAYVQSYLPEYMVPSVFMPIDAFPLTPNGKIDRKKLPEPERAQIAQHEIELPTTTFEKTLAVIWSEVLGHETIGTQDNFFALGGDSIQVVQVCMRAQQVHIPLAPGQLFRYQTIAALSRLNLQPQQDAITGTKTPATAAMWEPQHGERTSEQPESTRTINTLPASLTPNKLNKIMTQIQKGAKKRL